MKKIKSIINILSYLEMGIDTKSKILLFYISVIQLFSAPLIYISRRAHYKFMNHWLSSLKLPIYLRFYGKKFRLGNGRDFFILNTEDRIKEIVAQGGNVLIDVGAHIGSYSVSFADKYSSILSLEPDMENFRALKVNIKINKLGNKIKAINKAAGTSNEKHAKLFSGIDNTGGNSLLITDAVNTKKVQHVEIIKLDDLVKKHNIKEKDISIIKIDVEGFEVDVLRGMKEILKNGKPKIIVEIWNENKQNQKYISKLSSGLNYKFEKIEKDNWLMFKA